MRAVSFALALGAVLTLMLFPFLLRGVPASRLHAGLPMLMSGVASALVYGIGYIPDNRILRALFSPFCAWTLAAAGACFLF